MSTIINTPPLDGPLPVQSEKAIWSKPWGSWFTQVFQICFAVQQSGTSGQRPQTRSQLWPGRPYFDTDLGFPIWWDGAQWVNASGTPS